MAYPRSSWEADWHAYVYLIEFLATKWPALTRPAPPRDDATTIIEEIPKLVGRDADRKAQKDAILEQKDAFSPVMLRYLMVTSASHPRTFEVVKVAVLIGRAVVMYYKNEFKRSRPAQLSPQVRPMFDTPPHASYPSGHSTQAHLVAALVCELHPQGVDPQWRAALFKLAGEIAENREVAGVHYPSDSEAGKTLAAALFNILKEKTQCPKFRDLLEEAKKEWA